MTEIELTELRDSLVTINSELNALDVRVTALEDNAVPKGTYFNQLKASFADSPKCCDCGTTQGCDCTNAENVAYFFNNSDNVTFQDASFEINGNTYTWGGLSGIPDVLDVSKSPIYVFDSVTEDYLGSLYYSRIKSNSMNNLCVKITNVRDEYNNSAPRLEALTIPYIDAPPGAVYKIDYDINSADFTYTHNASIVNPVESTDDLSIVTFCLTPADGNFAVHTINMRLYESSITGGIEHYGEFVPNNEGSVYLSFKINEGDTETISFARSTLWPVVVGTSTEYAWVLSGGSQGVLYSLNAALDPFGVSINSQIYTVHGVTYFLSTLSRYAENIRSFRFVSSGVNAPDIDIAETLEVVNSTYYFEVEGGV